MFAGAGRKLAASASRPLIRHHVSSIHIDVDVTGGRAQASSYFSS